MSENYKVLVIEDEQPLLEVIKDKLESKGYEVVTARTAEQALDYLENQVTVNAIWLDHYLLGQENGLSLLTKLKKEEGEWRKIPVFVVSNTAGAETVQDYIRLGIDKYFTKADNRLDDIVSDITSFLESGEEED